MLEPHLETRFRVHLRGIRWWQQWHLGIVLTAITTLGSALYLFDLTSNVCAWCGAGLLLLITGGIAEAVILAYVENHRADDTDRVAWTLAYAVWRFEQSGDVWIRGRDVEPEVVAEALARLERDPRNRRLPWAGFADAWRRR